MAGLRMLRHLLALERFCFHPLDMFKNKTNNIQYTRSIKRYTMIRHSSIKDMLAEINTLTK